MLEGTVKNVNEHPSDKLSEEKRAQLFTIASGEFAAKGFAQASLNRIISEIGMSKSSFYHYFENKTDLYRQTLNQAMAPFLEARGSFDLGLLTAKNYWPTSQIMMQEMAKMTNSSPEVVMVGRMFYRSLENPEERELTRDIMAESTDWLTSLLRRGQDLGTLRDDLPSGLMIDMLMALGMSIDRWLLIHWDELSDEDRLKLNSKSFELFKRMLEI